MNGDAMRWVLGDIHGMLRPLEAIVTLLRSRDPHAALYFVGDYVNRGPDSRGVIEFLLNLGNARFARGNHDDVLDLILNDHWLGGDDARLSPRSACEWFHPHGLAQTLASYGISAADINECRRGAGPDVIAAIREAVPEAHKRFFHELPLVLDDDGLFVAHAYWPPDVANGTSSIAFHLAANPHLPHQVVWHRWRVDELMGEKPTWTRPAFFGHTPTVNYPASLRGDLDVGPILGPMVTLLDTAAALYGEGRLTAICVEDGAILQVDRAGKELV